MQEKRRYKRLDVDLPVTLRFGGRLIPATVLNISCGGVCLGLDEEQVEMCSNTNVEVIIDLSEDVRDLSLRGEIARVEGSDKKTIGIKFTSLYTLAHQTLENFINKDQN